jgi:hypothetical protein
MTDITTEPAQARPTALQRLDELRRGLQRLLRRKPSLIEKALMDRCALLMMRAEHAAGDPKCDSNDVVRLDNAARRARADFESYAGINSAHKPAPTTLAELGL